MLTIQKKLPYLLLLVFFLVFDTNNVFSGVWLRSKGSGYSQIGFTTKSYKNRYLGGYANTEKFGLRREVTQTAFSYYGEFGVLENLTLTTNVPFYMLSTGSEVSYDVANPFTDTLKSGSINSLGNIYVAIKYPIRTDGLMISAQLGFEFNTSTYDDFTGLRTGFDATTITPTILVGKGMGSTYFTAEAGPFFRTNGYNHGIVASGEYGWTPNSKTYLIGVANGIFKVTEGNHNDKNSKHTATFIDDQGYMAIGAKIFQKINEHFSVNATFFSGFAVINEGDNSGAIFIGAAYEW